jgi:chromosome segregation ATPase
MTVLLKDVEEREALMKEKMKANEDNINMISDSVTKLTDILKLSHGINTAKVTKMNENLDEQEGRINDVNKREIDAGIIRELLKDRVFSALALISDLSDRAAAAEEKLGRITEEHSVLITKFNSAKEQNTAQWKKHEEEYKTLKETCEKQTGKSMRYKQQRDTYKGYHEQYKREYGECRGIPQHRAWGASYPYNTHAELQKMSMGTYSSIEGGRSEPGMQTKLVTDVINQMQIGY